MASQSDLPLETEFHNYLDYIKTNDHVIQKQSTDDKLRIYALAKQAQFGDNTDPKPSTFDLKEKKKWEAWDAIKGLDQTVAMIELVKIAKRVLDSD